MRIARRVEFSEGTVYSPADMLRGVATELRQAHDSHATSEMYTHEVTPSSAWLGGQPDVM
jgi:hypothetical protein